MKLLVVEQHEGYGIFPLFTKGATVSELKPEDEYPTHAEVIWGSASNPNWVSCVIDGHETFIPEVYVANGILTCDYNPTELVVEKGKYLELIKIVFEWLYVKDENGKEGWIPANKVR